MSHTLIVWTGSSFNFATDKAKELKDGTIRPRGLRILGDFDVDGDPISDPEKGMKVRAQYLPTLLADAGASALLARYTSTDRAVLTAPTTDDEKVAFDNLRAYLRGRTEPITLRADAASAEPDLADLTTAPAKGRKVRTR